VSADIETDKEANVAHPRETFAFIGHDEAEKALADAFSGPRMHHAWLLTGPKGVGKATLAYRFARLALGATPQGPRPLDYDPADPICRRIAARAHGDLFTLRRGLNDRGRPRTEITVDEARALVGFFNLKPVEGGWRVAIIDAVDDLNRNAANALLKTLEEPPPKTVLLLVSHAPGGILTTIRSRCRRLDLRPLPEAAVRAAVATQADDAVNEAALRFAGGRPGRAIALAAAGVDAMHEEMLGALRRAAKEGPRAFLTLNVMRSGDRPERLALYLSLARDWLREAARAALESPATAPTSGALQQARRYAEAYDALLEIERAVDGIDMDPAHAFARAASVMERAVAA
jgi:DNA polymerase-3 subunit delta'